MSYPKSIPKRSPDKRNTRSLKLDHSRQTERIATVHDESVRRSKIVLAGNVTQRKKPKIPALPLNNSASSSSSRNMHRLEHSPHPNILKVNKDKQNLTSKPKKLEVCKRNIEVKVEPENLSGTKILTELIEDLLKTKKGGKCAGLKRLVNRNVRKTNENIPYNDLTEGVRHWDYYEGDTLDNMMHGYGRLSYVNGQSFTGYFAKGVANGNGTFYQKDGQTVIGLWQGGRLAKRLA